MRSVERGIMSHEIIGKGGGALLDQWGWEMGYVRLMEEGM